MVFSELSKISSLTIVQFVADEQITHLLTDSRKLILTKGAMFFAITGERNNAHKYISQVYAAGIRLFMIDDLQSVNLSDFPEANFVLAQNTITGLQAIAKAHRDAYQIDLLAITGSNAKTTIKEYLSQMLDQDFVIVKSPKSYNSQIGVPLSVWQINESHQLGIFEAGISKVGEMSHLQMILSPKFGLFTNIGSAHDEGFEDISQKINEKLKLFTGCEKVIYRSDDERLKNAFNETQIPTFSWSFTDDFSDIKVQKLTERIYRLQLQTVDFEVVLPSNDLATIENILHCVAFMVLLGFNAKQINAAIRKVKNIAMRLELKQGQHNCYLIDDTYNNDLGGLQVALEFLGQQHMRPNKSVIVSDLVQAGLQKEQVYQEMAEMLSRCSLYQIYAIGTEIGKFKNFFPTQTKFFRDVSTFLNEININHFKDEIILVKGARTFEFEKIVSKLQQKNHGTVLEINLEALAHNLNYYKSKLKPQTKLMAMVKAFAYGSGSFEVAQMLQYQGVDYLGVAYTNEAVDLRNNGIQMPIMVMNTSADNFNDLVNYKLEPEIFSFEILNELAIYLTDNNITEIKVHIDIDTGMRRLGFELSDLETLAAALKLYPQIKVVSVFSHLVGADEEVHNDFTLQQISNFKEFALKFEQLYGQKVVKHICNSAGVVAFPEAHFDMVRLGVGRYGVEATQKEQSQLRAVSTLKTVIAQIKEISSGESVGYGRRGRADVPKKIATINIGYADGYSRAFSRGVGKVLINGKLAPIIGNICMDMCMIDLDGIDAKVGDEVELFGEDLSILDLANAINTIPYEILTSVSERVKRVFYVE